MALVQYYDNYVAVVGVLWAGNTDIGFYQYRIYPNEVDTVMKAIDEGTVAQWVKSRSVDFETILDFHLECRYITIPFKDKDNNHFLIETEVYV